MASVVQNQTKTMIKVQFKDSVQGCFHISGIHTDNIVRNANLISSPCNPKSFTAKTNISHVA